MPFIKSNITKSNHKAMDFIYDARQRPGLSFEVI